ncbi:MAG: DUF4349 domain-containing protein [Lachnospiraceae bacterium]|nr:DUF4349 domain-containing protein [Lachnospiraceae bacterium]
MKSKSIGKGIIKAVACLCAVGMLAACGAEATKSSNAMYKSDYSGASSNYEMAEEYYESPDQLWNEGEIQLANSNSGTLDPEHSSTSQTKANKRKLIRNVSMSVETQEYATLMSNLDQRVKEVGGYVQNMDSYNGSGYYGNSYVRHANLVLRIPQDKLDEFVNSVSQLANVLSRSENVEDVTLQYVDVKSHKESLQVEQKRLLELLERAETLEDIITLENRLTSLRYQIESMESTLRTYDDLVDYSTVSIQISEVEVYTPVVEEKETNWERMTRGFLQSLENIGNGFLNFGIWFVIKLPYLVIWAIVITVIVLIVKKSLKKNNTRKFGKAKTEEPEKTEETPVFFGNNKPEEKK